MKTLYLDIFSGISGDMFIGALIDLGVDARQLDQKLSALEVGHYHLRFSRGRKSSIEGVKFDVHLEHNHSHPHSHSDEHEHTPTVEEAGKKTGPHGGTLLETVYGPAELSVFETGQLPRFHIHFNKTANKTAVLPKPGSIQLHTVRRNGARQSFKFKQRRGFLEATTDLPEPHEFTAVLTLKRGNRVERHEIPFTEEHVHDHDHPHHHDEHHAHDPLHNHDHDHHAHAGQERDFASIKALITQSALSDWVKEKAVAVFHRLAVAEGKIHGLPPEEVHFHEVGAVDSIVDIVGVCIGLELLGKPKVLAGPAIEGTGFIHCAHGRFPIPAPATLAILGARGIPLSQCDEPHELITPTGAALLAEFAETFGPMHNLVAEKIGFGLGHRDNKTRPNVLRAILGTASSTDTSAHDWQSDTIAVLEANVDDLNPEILGYVAEKALAAGALDVFFTPIQMKKNRPGSLLTILCAESAQDKFSEFMLRETSTFGVRRSLSQRRKLNREIIDVTTPCGQVRVKMGKLDGKVVHASPEFESCKKIAEKTKWPLKQIYDAAIKAVRAQRRPG